MIARHFRAGAAALALTVALVGCATQRVALPIAVAPTPIPPRPVAPAILAANYTTPPRAADGRYITINRGLSAAETVWHLRAALNVAALGCRGPEESGTIAAYNSLLARQKTGLAQAYKLVQAEHKARFGTAWQNEHDQRMTRVYNFFSQIQAHDAFCAASSDVLARAPGVAPEALQSFADAALGELEAPFTTFYAAWDDYRVQLASWDARYGPNADPALRYAAAPAFAPAAAPAATPVATPLTVPTPAPKLVYASIDDVFAWQRPVALAQSGAKAARTVSR
jgi:hypothetical protein